jgi:hypothetical protein
MSYDNMSCHSAAFLQENSRIVRQFDAKSAYFCKKNRNLREAKARKWTLASVARTCLEAPRLLAPALDVPGGQPPKAVTSGE